MKLSVTKMRNQRDRNLAAYWRQLWEADATTDEVANASYDAEVAATNNERYGFSYWN